jgi:hypothetical protein
LIWLTYLQSRRYGRSTLPLASTFVPCFICMVLVGLTYTIGGLYGCVSNIKIPIGMLYTAPEKKLNSWWYQKPQDMI